MRIRDYNGNTVPVGGGASPIAGKRIAMIGDSNLQYNSDTIKAHMEETYGCTFIPLGFAGASWETADGADAADNNGVGRVNTIVANVDSDKLITEYDGIVIMLGTNCNTLGTLEDTSERVDTMCGAMRYCLEKLCYYGRRIPIGVIVPIRNAYSTAEMPEKFACIEQIAQEYAVPTLNLYNAGRILPDKDIPDGQPYYLSDEVHLGGSGVLQIAHRIGKWIAYQL